MKVSDRYLKIVEWSDEDKCYIGTCPGLFLGGVHGEDEAKVYAELCGVVDEWIGIYREDKETLPPPTNKEYSGKFMLRIDKSLHRLLAVRALQAGRSLNAYCEEILAAFMKDSHPLDSVEDLVPRRGGRISLPFKRESKAGIRKNKPRLRSAAARH